MQQKSVIYLCLMFALAIFSNRVYGQSLAWGKPSDTSIAFYNNNIIKIETRTGEKIPVEDPETGEITYRKERLRKVLSLNERPVYSNNEAKAVRIRHRRWHNALERVLKADLNKSWNYFNEVEIVVDESGKVAYLDVKFWSNRLDAQQTRMDEALKKELNESISGKLLALRFKPAKKDGQPVAYHIIFY